MLSTRIFGLACAVTVFVCLMAACTIRTWWYPGESGVVRVFHGGQIEATLIPELWLLDRHHAQLSAAAAGAVEAQRLRAATFSVEEVREES